METVSTMGSGTLGREIDLEELSEAMSNLLGDDFGSKLQSSGMMTARLESDGPAFIFYRTGKFQIRGPKDRNSLVAAENQLLEVLDKLEFPIGEYDFEQQTSVFLDNINEKVNLEELAITLGLENVEYEPEQFPGLVYRPVEPDVTMLVFSSGKVIVSGTMDQNVAEEAVRRLKDHI